MTSGRPVAAPKTITESVFAPFSVTVLPFPSSSSIYVLVKIEHASKKWTY